MKRNISFIIVGLALVLLIGGAYVLYDKLSKEYSSDSNLVIDKPTQAPPSDTSSKEDTDKYNDYYNFTVTDWDSNEVQLKDFKGKPVILNFWASWCPPCVGELPYFEEAYKEYGDKVQFMIVNLTDGNRETVELAKKYITDNKYTFPVYFDTKADVAFSFSVSSIPATYLVDENGNIVGHAIGAIEKKDMEDIIKILLE